MWIPKSIAELEARVKSGELDETPSLEFKREIGKSKDVAIDIAAMSTDSGVICYGVAEDAHKKPTELSPISLVEDQAESRIAQIVSTCIAEPPEIRFKRYERTLDPPTGYLLVIVPQSPRAPHMVVVRGDCRYYGRTAKTNVLLTEGSVARLYLQRQRFDHDRDAELARVIAQASISPREEHAYIHLYVQPVVSHDKLLQGLVPHGTGANRVIGTLVRKTRASHIFSSNFTPDFDSGTIQTTSSGWVAYMSRVPEPGTRRDPNWILDLRIRLDGSFHLFCGRAAATSSSGKEIFEDLITGIVVRSLYLAHLLYAQANYHGMIDVGLALTGLKGGLPGSNSYRDIYPNGYPDDDYRRTVRLPILELDHNYYKEANELLEHFFRIICPNEPTPLANYL